jgi:predicted TIM-barrel fold metal-dependent hydrolase
MIIDAHTHVGESGEGPLATLGADKYVEILRRNGVDKGFAFAPTAGFVVDARAGNEGLVRARDRYPDEILPWGTVNPYWPEAEIRAEIRRCLGEWGFCGMKFHPWLQGSSLALPGYEIVAEECIAQDRPVTFHDGTPMYCTALQVAYYARQFPPLQVLSGHGGLRELWRDFIAPLRELPNLYVCLSGPTMQGIQGLYDAVGPDKLMFGSDSGFGHPATQANYLRRIRALHAPPEHLAQILGGNAARWVRRTEESKAAARVLSQVR